MTSSCDHTPEPEVWSDYENSSSLKGNQVHERQNNRRKTAFSSKRTKNKAESCFQAPGLTIRDRDRDLET